MTTKTIYIAHDGTTFNSECECVDYEKRDKVRLLRRINQYKSYKLPLTFKSYMSAKKLYHEALKNPKDYISVYHAAGKLARYKQSLYDMINQYKEARALLKEVNETEKYW